MQVSAYSECVAQHVRHKSRTLQIPLTCRLAGHVDRITSFGGTGLFILELRQAMFTPFTRCSWHPPTSMRFDLRGAWTT